MADGQTLPDRQIGGQKAAITRPTQRNKTLRHRVLFCPGFALQGYSYYRKPIGHQEILLC